MITELDKRINLLRNCARTWGSCVLRSTDEQLAAQRETQEAEKELREYIATLIRR